MPRSGNARIAQRAAGRYLEHILRQPGRPRNVWLAVADDLELQVAANDPTEFPQEAAGAAWLRYDYANDPDSLKPAELAHCRTAGRKTGKRMRHREISRALNGSPLTLATLERLIAVFKIPPHEEERLLDIWHGREYAPVVEGTVPPPAGMALMHLETTSVEEDHYIGLDGIPTHHKTLQYVRATKDGVDHFPHYFDTSQVRAALVLGGTQSAVMKHDENISVVHYLFNRPLMVGEIYHFRYELDFLYAKAPAPHYRRKIHGHYRNGWNVHVFFHPDRLPKKIWWAEWLNDNEDSPITHQELVSLDAQYSVHRHLASISRAVAGFHWVW